MKDKICVALVNACTAPIPDVLGGGAERLVTMLLDENEIENKIDLIVFSKQNKLAENESLKYHRSKIIYISPSTVRDKVIKILYKIFSRFGLYRKHYGYYSRVASYLKRFNVDVLIDENGYVPDFKEAVDVVGVEKTVAHIHWLVNPIKRDIQNNYRYAMGVSNYITDYWIKNSGNNEIIGKTVYSAVDEKRFLRTITENEREELKRKLGIPNNSCVVAYCGRIHEQKGPLELYKAFKKIYSKKLNATLLFIGGSDKIGSQLSEYHINLLNEAEDNKSVIFTGYIKNKDLYKYYQISDILVIPTLVEEAAGLVAIEGMLSGLPIIATRSGGLPEYVNEKCSILINKDDRMQEELCLALEKLILDLNLRKKMSVCAVKEGKKYTQKKYYNSFVNSVLDIVKEEKEYVRKKTTTY